MLKSEVREAVFTAVAGKLKPAGFSSKKKDHSFVRKFEGGFQELIFPIVDYSPEIIITLLTSIRLDAVADLAYQFNENFSPEVRARACSVRAGQRYFPGYPDEYSIRTESELAQAIESILTILTEGGICCLSWIDVSTLNSSKEH